MRKIGVSAVEVSFVCLFFCLFILQTIVALTIQQALGQTWLSQEMESLAKHAD